MHLRAGETSSLYGYTNIGFNLSDEEDTFSLDHFIQLTQKHVQIHNLNSDELSMFGLAGPADFQGTSSWFYQLPRGHNIWSTKI